MFKIRSKGKKELKNKEIRKGTKKKINKSAQ